MLMKMLISSTQELLSNENGCDSFYHRRVEDRIENSCDELYCRRVEHKNLARIAIFTDILIIKWFHPNLYLPFDSIIIIILNV